MSNPNLKSLGIPKRSCW